MEIPAERSETVAAEGNFSATRVRHYLTAGGAKVAHPACRGAPSVEALPVALLGRATGDGPLQIAALRRAVDLARDHTARRSTRRGGTHRERTELAEDRPPAPHATAGNSSPANVPCDNVIVVRVHPRRPRARSLTSGPFSLMAIVPIVPNRRPGGQLPGRGGLHRISRILAPVYSLGSTLANLRGHIESHGGAVVLATTLSASRRSEVLALRPETLHSLSEKHGELLDKYWRDHVGFGIDVLTEAEAGYLLRTPSVDAIRSGMAQARGG